MITSKGFNSDARIRRDIVATEWPVPGRRVRIELDCGHVRELSATELFTEQPERDRAYCPECQEILTRCDFGGDLKPEHFQ